MQVHFMLTNISTHHLLRFGTRCRYLHDEVRIQLNDKVTVLYSETEAILRGITHNDDGTISVQSHAYYPVFNLLQLFGVPSFIVHN